MKKHSFFIYLFAVFTILFAMTICASAAGSTVVYLENGGAGDGSSAASPVGSLADAYKALDLEKDCTVVVSGVFTQKEHFVYGNEYGGSVTLTSVYGGVDYRNSGATYEFEPSRFVLFGKTTFENMDFKALGTNLLVVAQHHPVTVGKGVTITGDAKKLTGGTVAKSFCILGGYQSGQSNPPTVSDKDTNITVLSGSKIYIVAFSRSIKGEFSGTANIKIGGDADVSVLHCSAAYPDGIVVGKVKVELTDDANIGTIYGTTQNTTIDSLEMTWRSGTIGKFEPVSTATPGKILNVKGDMLLNASYKAKTNANFSTIAASFDKIVDIGGGKESDKVATLTTVYLKDGGDGDGSTPANAVGSLAAAFEALNLEKDCKIVICGRFTQGKTFDYGKDYSGSVTITSVDGATDYRNSGAVYDFSPVRFVLRGKTTFESIKFNALGAYMLIIAQHHPITLGKDVEIVGEKLTGSTISTSFAILGGYQKGQSAPPLSDDSDTNITVLSGRKLYLVAFSRELLGEYTGTANIKIGGNAEVSVLHCSAAYPDGVIVGKTNVEITDNAKVGVIYGTTQNTVQDSLEISWHSGSIGRCEIVCKATPDKRIEYKGGTVLKSSDAAKSEKNYAAVAACFDSAIGIGESTDLPTTSKTEIPKINERYGSTVGLYKLGLVKGYDNSGTNFGLDDKLSRVQAVVQVIRYLGVEKEALAQSHAHPFTDVPAWADKYIGYAYANGITVGRSPKTYDPNGEVTESQFLTFMLRAIGYSDANGDFSWNAPEKLAVQCGMVDGVRDGAVFLRGDAFKICWSALSAKSKDGTRVADRLIAAGVFTEADLAAAGEAAKTAVKPAKQNTTEGGYYVLSKADYMDKTTSGFLAQLVGFLSGYEFARNSDGSVRIAMPDSWFEMCNGPYAEYTTRNPHEDKLLLNSDSGVWETWNDDDYSIDILNQYILRDMYATYGTVASKIIRDDWIKYDVYDMGGGHRTFGAYGLFKNFNYLPSFVGATEFGNLYNVNGEPYIANETLGMNLPGMPDAAVALAELFGNVTSDRDPTNWLKMFSAMISMAYFENDVPALIRKAADVLPEGSYEREVVDTVFRLKEEYPTDWRRAVTKAEKECYREHYDLESYVGETGINCSFILISLLYGDGDYYDTCRICSLAGHGGDSTTPVALSIVAVMNGMKNLPAVVNEKVWQDGKGVIVNRPPVKTDVAYHMYCAGLPARLKMSDIIDMYRENFEKLLVEAGGRIVGDNYYIPMGKLSTPDTLLALDDFESGNIDGYATKNGSASSENPFSGKFSAKIAGSETTDGYILTKVSGLTIGKTYRATAFIATSASTTGYLIAREVGATDFVYATVSDRQNYVKRSLTFTATAEAMEIGLLLPAGTAPHKSVVMDELYVVRVEEHTAASVTQNEIAAGGKYGFTVTGGDGREALLKITFSNACGKTVNAKITINGKSYATAPFYNTGSKVDANGLDATYIPLVCGADATTVTFDCGADSLYIRSAEVVRVKDRF